MKITGSVDGGSVSWEDGELSGDYVIMQGFVSILLSGPKPPEAKPGLPWGPMSPWAAYTAMELFAPGKVTMVVEGGSLDWNDYHFAPSSPSSAS